MANLLDSASIVLTPTAYDNGSMLSVKPNDGDGDFDFSRNSAATRVNAQGLVENVQILSGDLVLNGDFSQEGAEEVSNGSFSQEGAEQVTNGDFATDSDWALLGGWSIANGKLTANNATGYALQSGVFESGVSKTYKINLSVSDYVSGYFTILTSGGTSQSQQFNANGDYTIYFDSNSPSGTTLHFTYFGSFTGSIDNVSVKEVGQDWTLQDGWSIGEDKAVFDDTTTNRISQTGLSITSGKSYKINFTIADCPTTAHMTIYDAGGGDLILPNENYVNGSYTRYYTATTNETGVSFWGNTAGDTFSITNISVKEVGQDWTLGTGWSIGDDKVIATSVSNQFVTQSFAFTSGKRYRASFSVTGTSSLPNNTSLRLPYDGWGSSIAYVNQNSDGVHSNEFVSGGSSILYLGGGSFTGTITNISVIEITDDTNLPRINYEGFSYQDSLGSELVTNGNFATDSDWNKGSSTTISNGEASFNGALSYVYQDILTIGKTYACSVDVKNWTSGAALSVGSTATGAGTIYSSITRVSNTKTTFTFVAVSATLGIGSRSFPIIGSIDNVSVKEVLGQEVVPDSGCGSWLLEPQSTNLVTYSEDFSDAFWLIQNASVTLNNAISPDGTLSATKLIENTSNSIHRILNGAGLTVSGNVSMSIFAKKGERNWIRLTNNNIQGAFFDLDNGVVGNVIFGINAKIENYGNGWYKCSISQTGVANERLGVYTSIDGVNTTYQGDGTSGVYIWGAMLEQQSYATSYIPTNGAATTRLQDLANNSGNATLINSTEGVLYAEISGFENDLSDRYISLSDGGTDNSIRIFYYQDGGTIFFRKSVNAVQTTIFSTNAINKSELTKIAIKYNSTNFDIFSNGVKLSTNLDSNSFPINTLNEINFANADGLGLPFFGKVKALVVYKEALTDEQLICLTTI